jgi:hypothetical protein
VRPAANGSVEAAAAELAGDAALVADAVRWRDAAVLRAVETAWQRGDARAVRDLADCYDTLLQRLPQRRPDGVRLAPVTAAARRGLGAFATAPGTAAELAALALPEEVRAGPVCDPACGAGALLRAALDRLVAAGLPPGEAGGLLHGVDVDPVAVTLTRTVLAVDVEEAGGRCSPADLAARVVVGDALSGPVPARPGTGSAGGLAWHQAFADVLDVAGAEPEPVTGWRGGFTAVLANPPWERLKVLAGEHPTASASDLRRRRATVGDLAQSLRRHGRHPLTAAGELNAYLLFAETCWRLLHPDGRAAVLAPVGLATDASAGRLLRHLLAAGALERLEVRTNAGPAGVRAFSDLPDRQVFAVAVVRGRGGGAVARVRVRGGQAWRLDTQLLERVNPNTGTAPLCASPTDARLLGEVHERVGVLLRRDAAGSVAADPWRLRLRTPLHMSRDVRHFRADGGPGTLPLWEAKLAGLLDHRCATWDGRRARRPGPQERADQGWEPSTRWWVPEAVVVDRLGDLLERGWLAAFRNVTVTSSERTLLPCALPAVAVANSLPLVQADRLPLLLAALSSLPVDWAARQKIGGANLNFFKVEQLPVPPPEAYDVAAPWAPGLTVADWVLSRLADAVAWSRSLLPLAVELGRDAVPAPDPVRRTAALADLDAVHARLLGLSRADLEHVLGTFGALRARETAQLGSYATAERVLTAYDALEGLPAA